MVRLRRTQIDERRDQDEIGLLRAYVVVQFAASWDAPLHAAQQPSEHAPAHGAAKHRKRGQRHDGPGSTLPCPRPQMRRRRVPRVEKAKIVEAEPQRAASSYHAPDSRPGVQPTVTLR